VLFVNVAQCHIAEDQLLYKHYYNPDYRDSQALARYTVPRAPTTGTGVLRFMLSGRERSWKVLILAKRYPEVARTQRGLMLSRLMPFGSESCTPHLQADPVQAVQRRGCRRQAGL